MMIENESQEEFEQRYGKDYFSSGRSIALRCNCEEAETEHWAAIPNDSESIAAYEKWCQVIAKSRQARDET